MPEQIDVAVLLEFVKLEAKGLELTCPPLIGKNGRRLKVRAVRPVDDGELLAYARVAEALQEYRATGRLKPTWSSFIETPVEHEELLFALDKKTAV